MQKRDFSSHRLCLLAVVITAAISWIASRSYYQHSHGPHLSLDVPRPSKSCTLNSILWKPWQPVPWERITEAYRKQRGFSGPLLDHKLRLSMSHECSSPVFLERSSPLILLASVPGSGNFWTRYMLEQLTGVYTGSVYPSETPEKTRLGGGTVSNSSVIVVKTHSVKTTRQRISQPVDGVILLVRNPFDAAKAEFSRQATRSNTQAAATTLFKQRSDLWKSVSDMASKRFETLISYWIPTGLASSFPVYVVYFDDLRVNLRAELRKLAKFLNVAITEEKLECVVRNRKGLYKRPHPKDYDKYDPFTPSMVQKFNGHIQRVSKILPRVASYQRPVHG